MTTREKIEYKVEGFNGSKWCFVGFAYDMKQAEQKIADHKRDVSWYPKDFTYYSEYRVLSRKVITITEEWK